MNSTVKNEIVLVVGCHHSNYQQLFKELEAIGFKVSIENEIANVVITAESLQPELILIEISHLESRELEICHQLKNNLNTQNISLILIASLAQSFWHKKLNCEGVDWIIKPARLEEISVRIKTHIATRRINSQLQQEIANRCQIESLLKQSQQLLKQKFGNEIWELIIAKQELTIDKRDNLICDRELEEFAHLVSQDLQALSQSLGKFTKLVEPEEQIELSEEEIEYVEHIADSDKRMQSLIQDLLVYANTEES